MSAPKKPAAAPAPAVSEPEAHHEAEDHHDAAPETPKPESAKSEAGALGLKPGKNKPSLDESIQLALASAGTAADASKEIQRLKKQVNDLVANNSRSNKVLLSTGVIFLFMASIALGVSVAFYFKAMNRFDSITNVNRDALMAFAEEVNAFTEAATRVEQAATASEKRLAALSAQQEEIKVAIQGDLANQQAIAAKLAENSETINQMPAATRKVVDDLLASNKLIVGQVADALREQIKAFDAANPKVDIAKQLEEVAKAQQAASIRTATIEAQKNVKSRKPVITTDQMIKYP
jgi:hypothetical protein